MAKSKKKILLCWGTRPESLKMAPLAIEMKKSKQLQPIVLLTGQHIHMANQVMKLFNLKADYNLKLMTHNQSLSSLSERILKNMERMLKKIKPDCVLVQGDTSTAFLVALSAFYLKIPVGHVEAGLRSDDKYEPFPEEINRRLITQVADFHFAPTSLAFSRLVKEGVPKKNIVKTGNTGIDALIEMKRILKKRKKPPIHLDLNKRNILLTAHRRESFGAPFKKLCQGIQKVARFYPDIDIYYPVHLNPNVQKVVKVMLKNTPNIHLIEPVAYDSLVYMMQHSDLILTDSGGIQEEAPSFYKPILVLRNVTERPEGVKAGFSRIVGQEPERIFKETKRCLDNPELTKKLQGKPNPYGDGKASKRIIQFLSKQIV